MKANKYIGIFLLILLALPVQALAHKVVVFAYAENGKIFVEAGFGSKRPCKQAPVTVTAVEDESPVHQGITNDDGKYSFDLPQSVDQDLLVRVDAGQGHAGQWKLSREKLVQAAPDPTKAPDNPFNQDGQSWRLGLGILIIFLACFGYRWFKGNPSDKWRKKQ
ncbi:MAG: hypothetical protein MI747_10175 [Desulfobacterales bacterium]|nr:hypothetical protein [Desulfobacterales bacterium]